MTFKTEKYTSLFIKTKIKNKILTNLLNQHKQCVVMQWVGVVVWVTHADIWWGAGEDHAHA